MLVGAAVYLMVKSRGEGDPRERIESILNEKFIGFSKDIRESMDSARREVSSSKDMLSENAQKTLEHINSMNKTVSTLVAQQEKAEKLGQSLEYLLQAPKYRHGRH